MSQANGSFQCDNCPRRYKRIDYLIRHKRSHTQSKPYKCWTCFKSFARVDILKRHMASHASTKILCTGPPGSKTQKCTYSEDGDIGQGEVRSMVTNQPPELIVDSSRQDLLIRPHESSLEHGAANAAFTDPMQLRLVLGPDVMNPTGNLDHNFKSPKTQEQITTDQNVSCVGFSASGGSVENMDMTMSYQENFCAEIGFTDADLEMLDAFISTLPSDLYSLDTSEVERDQEPKHSLVPLPAGETDTDVEPRHGNLLHIHHPRNVKPETRGKRRRASTDLKSASRNRILTALVQWGPKEITRIIEVLPPVDPLDGLLHSYLNAPVAHARTFIHVATFNPNETRPDLLLAMLASSCALSTDVTLNKLGRVLQECVLASLPKHFEAGNSTTQDLELAQAFLITLEVGTWSGHMRTTEAAESFFQPLLTMIRRSGMLNSSGYTQTSKRVKSDESLQEKWLGWIHLESWKRLVCRIYKHDTNSSIALQVNQLISYAEFCLPLPASSDMWSAATAEEWNSLFLARQQNGSSQQVTLTDYIDDVDGTNVSDATTDLSIVREVFLSFAWGLSWEYIQLVRFQTQRPSKWNLSIMNSRYNELNEILNRCYKRADPDAFVQLASELKINCICMHLHLSFHDIQAFFKASESLHARKIYFQLVQWAKSEHARKSVCYAARLLHIARLSPKGTIRGPCTIMVYQAALTLIAYGVVCIPFEGDHNQKIVQIYKCEDISVQQFIQSGCGVPAIEGNIRLGDKSFNSTVVCLTDLNRVIEEVSEIFKTNYRQTKYPPIIHEVMGLLAKVKISLVNLR
ncbi:hypothetical protein DER46DRAFT_566571 [Fusarium sp. MPI-SDFR-AT-0072]|nr:hypothetical protein DER46DRAFT_566571 [Fusarium sp. MPI-SDFR-AT-0072]